MSHFYILLGRYAQELGILELNSVFSRHGCRVDLTEVHKSILLAIVDEEDRDKAIKACSETGSVIKILEDFCEFTSEIEYEAQLATKLSEFSTKRFLFSITDHRKLAENDVDPILIKRSLKDSSVSSRYIKTEKEGMPWIAIHLEDGIDLHLVSENGVDKALRATWVQPVDSWVKRDMDKPYRDTKVGMLPPKLARLMVNLGLSRYTTKQPTVLDPYCGTGTVLMEAALLGSKVIGSDLRPQTVQGAEKNLDWLADESELTLNKRFLVADAANMNKLVDYQTVDAIVTEPYLGDPRWTDLQLPKMLKSLEELYIGSFRSWLHVLKPGGRVIIVFPEFLTKSGSINFDYLVDRLDSLGYTRENDSIRYDKPGARLQRRLYIFTKKTS